jgi:replication-associated recombination protein RarA
MFDKIKGHRSILSQLEKEIGDIEGVYLFTGPGSVGKLTVARQLAKYLLCMGLVDDTCRCESCRLLPNVPDYLEISKGDETIVMSDVDSIIEFVSLVPYKSRLRVVVIDNVHNLNTTASNNLLKTLEDLKSNCLVILVTNQSERVIPTLVSRCYRVEFGPLKTDEIIEILKSKGHDAAKLADVEKMIPYMTGNLLVDFVKYMEYVKYVPQFAKSLLSMKEDDLIVAIKEIDEKQDMQYFVEIFIIYLNDILKIRYDSPDVVYNLKKIDAIENLSGQWKQDLCVMALDKLHAAHANMRRGVNLKHGQYILPVFLWMHYFLHKQVVNAPK